jgi:hypothetical protein
MDKIATGKYRHYKGKDYSVLGCARHSETEEWLVVYKPLYNDSGLWVRPLAMFTQDVTLASGDIVPRFKFVSES